jgi:hypothetical protein
MSLLSLGKYPKNSYYAVSYVTRMQNRENFPEFIRELSMESTFRSAENRDVYVYGYATYDKSKLYGPQLEKTQMYNIQAHGRIPIAKKEF